MAKNPLFDIETHDQSIWMDFLDRRIIKSGELEQQIDKWGLQGLTSNPSIFAKAIGGSDVYDSDIEAGAKAGKSVVEVYESLVFEDIRNACDIFRPIYDKSNGEHGYVSIEVSPDLARDTDKTIDEARRYFREIDRPNVMVKIPGTPEGFPAIEQAISEGININITLLFSVESYEQAAWAYIRGLERRVENDDRIDNIASVASFFLSRIDVKIDDIIEDRLKSEGTENLSEEARLRQLKGKIAIANAKIAYQKFKEIFGGDRWQALAEKGATIQRVLWASTSTKNPDYSDVMYVNSLVGPHTVNTMPTSTLEACADHCDVDGDRVEEGVEEAQNLMASLSSPDINIDLDRVMDELLEEGIEKFVKPYNSVLDALKEKIDRFSPVGV